MTRILVAFSFLIFQSAFPAGTATSTGNPVIEAVFGKGAPALVIAGEEYELREGQELQPGNKVVTDEESAVRIVYADNSQLYVGRSSSVEITGVRGGAPVTTLTSGKTRAIVAKSEEPEKKGKVKFLIRTKSAVMGVRGTDFVTQTDAEGLNAQVHTLEGQVAVTAPGDENNLFAGKGVLLGPNQFIMTKLGAALGTPQLFQRAQFLKSLSTDNPGFKNLMDRMPRGYQQLMKLRGSLEGLGNQLQKNGLQDLQKLRNLQNLQRRR